MSIIENAQQNRQELIDGFKLYLRECENIEVDDIDGCVKELEERYKIDTGKVLFDFDGDDPVRPLIIEQETVSLDENNLTDEKLLQKYDKFIDAYKFAFCWCKPKKIECEDTTIAKNIIVFGAPGTGKSWYIEHHFPHKNKDNTSRVTFHPETDYASFVGCYKPTKGPDGDITYEFVPQAFINAYVNAWKLSKDKAYYLVIEEINRGNCAQIFGDLFQLLDRDEEGVSTYPVTPDTDLQHYLRNAFANGGNEIPEEIREGKSLRLPSNLWILASMNTSDQSLYPMDSAFKRRWEWHYIPITYDRKLKFIVSDARHNKGYSWQDFLDKINSKIKEVTKSEDKQLGFWFTGKSQIISLSTFVNKVLFYLWSDVFKDYSDGDSSPFAKSNLVFQNFFNSRGELDINNVKTFIKDGIGLDEMENISQNINESEQVATPVKGNWSVVYNGQTYNDRYAKDVFIKVIEAIGADKIYEIRDRVSKSLFIVKNVEELRGRDNVQLKSNGMYLLVNLSNNAKKNILYKIKEELHLELTVNETSD